MSTRCASLLSGFEENLKSKQIGVSVIALIYRLDHYQQDILRFMNEGHVSFTNNLAERDLRMVTVRQKISGTFKNIDRASDICTIRRNYFYSSETGERDT